MALYELALLGNPTPKQTLELQCLTEQLRSLLGLDAAGIALRIAPEVFRPSSQSRAAALFIGGPNGASINIAQIVDQQAIPVIPVASEPDAVAAEIPECLRAFNCLFLNASTLARLFAALLESVGLLPRQRRVFLSYRRKETTAAAIQLFAELSARQFDVFLDTHSIGGGLDFQEQLWHQLSDVDVLLMLESPGYFTSRWTVKEYGRALAKGIGVLSVQWPHITPRPETSTAIRVELLETDLQSDRQLIDSAVHRVCHQLEVIRSLSNAVRLESLMGSVRNAVTQIEGHFDAVGPGLMMRVTLRNGQHIVVQPMLGIPTSMSMQETILRAGQNDCAIVYNHYGMMKLWEEHLEWLSKRVGVARWIRQSDVAWDLAGLDVV